MGFKAIGVGGKEDHNGATRSKSLEKQQWRIQDFPDGGANLEGGGASLSFGQNFPKIHESERN